MSFDPSVWFEFKEFVRHSTGWPINTQLFVGAVLAAGVIRFALLALGSRSSI